MQPDSGEQDNNGDSSSNPLTAKEQQILRLIAEGAITYQIAREMGVSENTIKYHVNNIHTKLGVASRTQALAVALRNGWL